MNRLYGSRNFENGVNTKPLERPAAFRTYLTMGLALSARDPTLLTEQISLRQELGLHNLRMVPIGILPSGALSHWKEIL